MMPMVTKRYDLHLHTMFSFDSAINPLEVVAIAKKAGLDGIAITEHGNVKGGLFVKKRNKDPNFEVIVGEEVKTDCGEIVGLYLKRPIRSRSLLGAIDEIKKQGGLVVIVHPYKPGEFTYPIEKLRGKVDAIEAFTAKYPVSNRRARMIAKKLGIAVTGSSDSHMPFDVGRGYTMFEGDLRTAIKKRKTRTGGRTYGPLSSVLSFFYSKLRPLGLGGEFYSD